MSTIDVILFSVLFFKPMRVQGLRPQGGTLGPHPALILKDFQCLQQLNRTSWSNSIPKNQKNALRKTKCDPQCNIMLGSCPSADFSQTSHLRLHPTRQNPGKCFAIVSPLSAFLNKRRKSSWTFSGRCRISLEDFHWWAVIFSTAGSVGANACYTNQVEQMPRKTYKRYNTAPTQHRKLHTSKWENLQARSLGMNNKSFPFAALTLVLC